VSGHRTDGILADTVSLRLQVPVQAQDAESAGGIDIRLRLTYGCVMAGSSARRVPSAVDRAAQIVAEAPDERWVRDLVGELDRRIRTTPLERLLTLWSLSASEAARIFGVSRQAFAKWLQSGPPADRAPDVAAMAAATDLLDRHVKRERIAAVVRRPATQLGGASLHDLASQGLHDEVRQAVEGMFDLRRIQP
jgi:hypothetical protein